MNIISAFVFSDTKEITADSLYIRNHWFYKSSVNYNEKAGLTRLFLFHGGNSFGIVRGWRAEVRLRTLFEKNGKSRWSAGGQLRCFCRGKWKEKPWERLF